MSYTLTYFDGRGRAEAIRYIFALAGEKYTDNRIDFTKWASMKQEAPIRSLPILELEGDRFGDSVAIGHLLAGRFGLVSTDPAQAARQLMMANFVEGSIIDKIVLWKFPVNDKFKEDLEENLKKVRLPAALGVIEKQLLEGGDAKTFIIGDKISFADCYVVAALMWVHDFDASLLDGRTELNAYKKRVEATAAIADWIKKRPDTPF